MTCGFAGANTKSGSYNTGVKYKGKTLKVEWAAAQPNTKSKKGAFIYFHGDGGGSGYSNAPNRFKSLQKKYGFHIIGVRAPVSHSWQGPINMNNPSDPYPNAQAFDKFLFHYISKYNVDPNKIYFAGVSGGAMFISGHYVPTYGRGIKGGMLLLCGGATSAEYSNGKAAFRTSANFSRNFKVYQHITKDDHLFQYAKAAKHDYSALGHPYKTIWPPKGGHCGFSINGAVNDGLKWMKPIIIRR